MSSVCGSEDAFPPLPPVLFLLRLFLMCVCVCVVLILKEKGVRVLKKAEKRDNKKKQNFQKFEKNFT